MSRYQCKSAEALDLVQKWKRLGTVPCVHSYTDTEVEAVPVNFSLLASTAMVHSCC